MADCTIIDKLNYILETKDLIKTAIETQDVEVLESDTFRKYSEYITEIRKVASVNGETGDIVLKTINGQNLVGEGDIIIQGGGGGSATAGVNKLILGEEDYGWNAYQGDVKLKSGFMQFDEGDVGYDIGVSGTDAYGGESGTVWFGFRSTDGSLLLEDAGGRIDLKVNPDILGGGGSVTETDPVFTEWKNGESIALGKDSTNEGSNNIAIGNTVKANGEGSIAIGAATIYDEGTEYEDIYPTEANGVGSIAIGNETIANNTSLAIGSRNNINNASAALGMDNTITSEYSLAVGNNNLLEDGSFKFAYGYFNEPKNNQEINIGILCKSRTGNTDAERTHFVISSYNNRNGEDNTSCFEIRNDDSIYIKMNGQLVKLQDKLNINIPETDLSDYYTKEETYSKDEVDSLLENSGGGSTAGVEAINVGRDIQDWIQKTGVVSFYTDWYDGSYDVAIGGTSFFGIKPIDDSIILENAGGTVNGNTRCGIKINTDNFKTINGESIIGKGNITIEGGGGSGGGSINIIELTQAEYDALTEYADNTFYVITDANKQYTTLEEVEQQGYLKEHQQLKTINGESIVGEGNITIEGGGSVDTSKFITYVGMMGDTRIAVMTDNNNLINEIYFPTINGKQILGVEGDVTISTDLTNYYTKSEIDNLIGGVSDKISDINSMI